MAETSITSSLFLEEAEFCLQAMKAQERLDWGKRQFGDGFAATTSFGIQSAVLLHMICSLPHRVPVIWVDTGYLPPETYCYAERLCKLLKIDLHVAQSPLSPARMEALHGQLWQTGEVSDLDTYDRLRKVEPLDQALESLGMRCWASGARGDQTGHRQSMRFLNLIRDRMVLYPLHDWTTRDTSLYIHEHGLPKHPLSEQGYSTVGDWHSSSPDRTDASGRETRFRGLKQECGIHLPNLNG